MPNLSEIPPWLNVGPRDFLQALHQGMSSGLAIAQSQNEAQARAEAGQRAQEEMGMRAWEANERMKQEIAAQQSLAQYRQDELSTRGQQADTAAERESELERHNLADEQGQLTNQQRLAEVEMRRQATDEAKAAAPLSVSPGATLLDPDTLEPLYTAPGKREPLPADVVAEIAVTKKKLNDVEHMLALNPPKKGWIGQGNLPQIKSWQDESAKLRQELHDLAHPAADEDSGGAAESGVLSGKTAAQAGQPAPPSGTMARADEAYQAATGKSKPAKAAAKRVRVKSPDGKPGTLPAEQIDAAKAAGWTVLE